MFADCNLFSLGDYWSQVPRFPLDFKLLPAFAIQCLTPGRDVVCVNGPFADDYWHIQPPASVESLARMERGLADWDEAFQDFISNSPKSPSIFWLAREAGIRLWRKSLICYFNRFGGIDEFALWLRLIQRGVDLVRLSTVWMDLLPPPHAWMEFDPRNEEWSSVLSDKDLLKATVPRMTGEWEQDLADDLLVDEWDDAGLVLRKICRDESRYIIGAIWRFMRTQDRSRPAEPPPVETFGELNSIVDAALVWCQENGVVYEVYEPLSRSDAEDGEPKSENRVLHSALAKALKVTTSTVTKYARIAGIAEDRMPGRGKRNHHWEGREVEKIFESMKGEGYAEQIEEAIPRLKETKT